MQSINVTIFFYNFVAAMYRQLLFLHSWFLGKRLRFSSFKVTKANIQPIINFSIMVESW